VSAAQAVQPVLVLLTQVTVAGAAHACRLPNEVVGGRPSAASDASTGLIKGVLWTATDPYDCDLAVAVALVPGDAATENVGRQAAGTSSPAATAAATIDAQAGRATASSTATNQTAATTAATSGCDPSADGRPCLAITALRANGIRTIPAKKFGAAGAYPSPAAVWATAAEATAASDAAVEIDGSSLKSVHVAASAVSAADKVSVRQTAIATCTAAAASDNEPRGAAPHIRCATAAAC
jgi:hypothetical protein